MLSAALLLLAGCSSSPYNYYVEPSPIKSGEAKYNVSEIKVNLMLGHGAIEGDTSFASESVLSQQFSEAFESNLKDKNLLASSGDVNAYDVVIHIDYTRKFNAGGKSLNKPEISHSVTVEKNGEKLASFGQSKYTTKYAYLSDAAVNFEIATFQWGADDESRDVDLIAQVIVDDLANLGD